MNPTPVAFHLSRQIYLYPFKPFFSISPYNSSVEWKRVSTKGQRNCSSIKRRSKENDYDISPWDEKPYEILPTGKISYIDEQDIVSFIDPPSELIPIDRDSYNPAAYLWKKIGDIPEERRPRLLSMVKPRLISRMWEIAGTRYEDANLAKKCASVLLSLTDNSLITEELWACRTSKGPLPIASNLIKDFNKVIFRGKDGGTYGRIILGGLISSGIANMYGPLYFTVQQATEVMSTEQPCDLAYEFGDGLLNLRHFPHGFPEPRLHGWPFNDHLVIYVRHAGPGVLVGQAWQEGKDLEQVPKKFCDGHGLHLSATSFVVKSLQQTPLMA